MLTQAEAIIVAVKAYNATMNEARRLDVQRRKQSSELFAADAEAANEAFVEACLKAKELPLEDLRELEDDIRDTVVSLPRAAQLTGSGG